MLNKASFVGLLA